MNLDSINQDFLKLDVDYLYHLGIDSSIDLVKLFGNVRWVIFTRSNHDAQLVAHTVTKKLYAINEDNFELNPLYKTERFYFYHIQDIIIVSTGIGIPSTSICLNEITKLLIHAKVKNPTYLHIGSASGIGLALGTLLINDKAVNTKFESVFNTIECGTTQSYPAHFNNLLSNSLYQYAKKHAELNNILRTNLYQYAKTHGDFNVKLGSVITTNDYYDEQARLDGFLIPDYTYQEQQQYLNNAQKHGILAMNMEGLLVAGFCNQLGISATAISVIVNDCLITDVVNQAIEKSPFIINAASLCIKYIMEDFSNAE